jgi:prephenate dehydrogenase
MGQQGAARGDLARAIETISVMKNRIAILGGTGGMGQWFARYFKEEGLQVILTGRVPEKTAHTARKLDVAWADTTKTAVQNVDIVLVATPLNMTNDTIREVIKFVDKGTILFDIASVKGSIIDDLKEAAALGIKAISTHPLFGPGAPSLTGRNMLVIPVYDDAAFVNEFTKLFEGARIRILGEGIHDRMMALTLALPHFLNIVFGKVLTKGDITSLRDCAGTTFELQLLLTESVYNGNSDLYFDIQSINAVFSDVLGFFKDALADLENAVTSKNRDAYATFFNETKKALMRDEGFEKAYPQFYKALDALHT